jgi:RNA polymerase sigma-70 factor (ECF subfamily)
VPISLAVRPLTRDRDSSGPSSIGEADDAADLAAWAAGDREAFARLYRRYVNPIYRYCHRRLGNREAAEDATAIVFTKVLTGLTTHRGGPFRSWVFAIAHNVLTDQFRAAKPTEQLEMVAEIVDSSKSPEDQALAAEEGRWLRGLLGQLPADQRQVVELRLSGLTNPEIAHVLGRNHAAVRSAQSRAVARLRALLGMPSGKEAHDA